MLVLILPAALIFDDQMILGGSTSVAYLFKKIKEENTLQNRKKYNNFVYHSIGSSAAVKRVVDNAFLIGFLSKDPKNEIDDYKKDYEIDFFPLIDDDLVFIYHLPNGCELRDKSTNLNLTWKQLTDIFTTDVYWKDLSGIKCDVSSGKKKIYIINRENGSGTRYFFEKKIKEQNPNQKIIFKFDTQVKSNLHVLTTVNDEPGTLSYLSWTNFKEYDANQSEDQKTISFFSLENAIPENKNYQLQRTFYGVYLKENQAKIKEEFCSLKFFNSPKIKKEIQEIGYSYQGCSL